MNCPVPSLSFTATALVWSREEWTLLWRQTFDWARALAENTATDQDLAAAAVAMHRAHLTLSMIDARGAATLAGEIASALVSLFGGVLPASGSLAGAESDAALAQSLLDHAVAPKGSSSPALLSSLVAGILRLPLVVELLAEGGRDDHPVVRDAINEIRLTRGLQRIRDGALTRRISPVELPLPKDPVQVWDATLASPAIPDDLRARIRAARGYRPWTTDILTSVAGVLHAPFRSSLMEWMKSVDGSSSSKQSFDLLVGITRLVRVGLEGLLSAGSISAASEQRSELIDIRLRREEFLLSELFLGAVRAGFLDRHIHIKHAVALIERDLGTLAHSVVTERSRQDRSDLSNQMAYYLAHEAKAPTASLESTSGDIQARAHEESPLETIFSAHPVDDASRLFHLATLKERSGGPRRRVAIWTGRTAGVDALASRIFLDEVTQLTKDVEHLGAPASDADADALPPYTDTASAGAPGPSLADVRRRVVDLAATATALGWPDVRSLLDAISASVESPNLSTGHPSEQASVLSSQVWSEVAGSVLSLQAVLEDRIGHADSLPTSGGEPLLTASLGRVSPRQSLFREIGADILNIRAALIGWSAAPDVPQILVDEVPRLHHVSGALSVLGEPSTAVLPLIAILADCLERVSRGDPSLAHIQRFDSIASLVDAVACLEYYLEACRDRQPQMVLDHVLALIRNDLHDIEISPASSAAPSLRPSSASGAPAILPEAPLPEAPRAAEAPLAAVSTPVVEAPVFLPQPEMARADQEVREIFAEELDELIDSLSGALPGLDQLSSDAPRWGQIRAVFHTIKGSGRTVGAIDLADMASALEEAIRFVHERAHLTNASAWVPIVAVARDNIQAYRLAWLGEQVTWAHPLWAIDLRQAREDLTPPASAQAGESSGPTPAPTPARAPVSVFMPEQLVAPSVSELLPPTLADLSPPAREKIPVLGDASAASRSTTDRTTQEPADKPSPLTSPDWSPSNTQSAPEGQSVEERIPLDPLSDGLLPLEQMLPIDRDLGDRLDTALSEFLSNKEGPDPGLVGVPPLLLTPADSDASGFEIDRPSLRQAPAHRVPTEPSLGENGGVPDKLDSDQVLDLVPIAGPDSLNEEGPREEPSGSRFKPEEGLLHDRADQTADVPLSADKPVDRPPAVELSLVDERWDGRQDIQQEAVSVAPVDAPSPVDVPSAWSLEPLPESGPGLLSSTSASATPDQLPRPALPPSIALPPASTKTDVAPPSLIDHSPAPVASSRPQGPVAAIDAPAPVLSTQHTAPLPHGSAAIAAPSSPEKPISAPAPKIQELLLPALPAPQTTTWEDWVLALYDVHAAVAAHAGDLHHAGVRSAGEWSNLVRCLGDLADGLRDSGTDRSAKERRTSVLSILDGMLPTDPPPPVPPAPVSPVSTQKETDRPAPTAVPASSPAPGSSAGAAPTTRRLQPTAQAPSGVRPIKPEGARLVAKGNPQDRSKRAPRPNAQPTRTPTPEPSSWGKFKTSLAALVHFRKRS